MGKTNFVAGDQSLGTKGTKVTAAFLNAINNHVHNGVDEDGGAPKIDIAQAASDLINRLMPVGAVQYFSRSTAPTGWLKANGGTIGSATSGATLLAHADAADLYTVLWNDFDNTLLPIQTSAGAASVRGASAAADFAANKRLPVHDLRGEFIRGLDDTRGVDAARVLGSAQSDELESHNHIQGETNNTMVGRYGQVDTGVNTTARYTANSVAGTPSNLTSSTGGTETRPRNIALLACIKY